MSVRDIIDGKNQWRAHVARVKRLPQDYQTVYREIQKYLFKVGPVELTEGTGLLSMILDLFEEGTASGKDVLDVTGGDVAEFCDELIKDSETYADRYQESLKREVARAVKKATSRSRRRRNQDGNGN